MKIDAGDDGRALLFCHAGCHGEQIASALGLTMADLAPPPAKSRRIVANYPYTDEQGELLYETVRYEPKGFSARRPDEMGDYVWNLKGVRRVLFRLPEVIEAIRSNSTVYVCEGEKDVLSAEAAGLAATCNPGGAKKWRAAYTESLRGARVVVVADRDVAGEAHARIVAEALDGVAESVELRQAAVGKDLTDHLAAGRSVHELEPLPEATEPLAEDPGPHPLTDTGNAERFHDFAGHDLRYCHPWKKWLTWDGARWRIDNEDKVMAISKAVARRICDEAARTAGPKDEARLLNWARKCESRGKRRAMVELFASEPGVAVQPDDLDRDPWLLNCENGTLDLRTGSLRPHDREDSITKLLEARYEPTATCPRWDAFLEQVLPSAAVREFVQRMVGHALTGDVSAQALIFCHGLGANGKSTFLRVLLALLGKDYAIQAAPQLLLERTHRAHPTEIADLFGVRLAVCVEIGAGRKFDEVLIKQLTGGDILRARRMREDFWQFEPTHHIWIAANHKPTIEGTDEATWRRVMLVPFEVTIPEEQRDGELLTKLLTELPGILAWAMRGCLQWQEISVAAPEEVRAATAAYRSDMDIVGEFLDAACDTHPSAAVSATELYNAFSRWASGNGEQCMGQQHFGQRVAERGFERRKRRGRKVYIGLGIRCSPGGPGGPGGPEVQLPEDPMGPGSKGIPDVQRSPRKGLPPSPRSPQVDDERDPKTRGAP